ncbi:MAG: HGGxSTG domain-containing protein [Xanthobacteraceae bacterium]
MGCGPNRRINLMHLDMHRARHCGAKTRSGKPCQSPAMANGKCRMHGGPSPGAPKGNRHAYKHGRFSAEAIARRREISAVIREAQALAKKQ